MPHVRSGRRRDTVWAVALVLAALGLRCALISNGSRDLLPRPDALEYSAMAWNLSEGRGLALELDGQLYPSRYPFGTALALLPAVLLAGRDPAFGFVANLLYGALAVLLTFLLARRATGRAAAVFAGLVLLFCPRHATLSSLPMSEVPSTLALLVLVLLFLGWCASRHAPFALAGLGLLAGLAASIRWPNLLVLTPVVLWLLLQRHVLKRPLQCGAWLVAGVVLGLVPELWYRCAFFGSPFVTGYHYWEPDAYGSWQTSYNPRFLWESARAEWNFGNLEFYARGLSGYRAVLLTPVTSALALFGAWSLRRRWREPLPLVLWTVPVVMVAFYLPYFFRDQRMNVVLVPFLAVLAAFGVQDLARRVRDRSAQRVGYGLLVVGLLVGVGWGPDRGVVGELAKNLDVARRSRPATLHEALREAGRTLQPGTVLVADLARLHLAPYVPAGLEILNLCDDVQNCDEQVRLLYRHQQAALSGTHSLPRVLFRGDTLQEDALRFLQRAHAEGRPIELWARSERTPFYRFASAMTARFETTALSEESTGGPLQRGRLVPKGAP